MFNSAWAQDAAAGAASGATGASNPLFSMLLMWVPIILIFYFLVIRPGKKKQDARREMLNNLSKGDRVITQGGFIGTIVSVTDKTITLKIAENVKVKMLRSAVAGPADSMENQGN
ncbi:MAG: preprotein translocase subunit YajC [Candidatus Hydrogenedentes bacterium]|nr:preprotein translocase subunit YajC [Candidatus Hydrogenedentota bacterium]